jgi:hypothetical protein
MLKLMARGWESKAVEAQQQDLGAPRGRSAAPLSPAQRLALDRRRTLELARARTAADLEASTSPAHRSMLEEALRALDLQLRHIG